MTTNGTMPFDASAGFTLVETLVVLAIVGLSLAGSIWALKPIRDRGVVAASVVLFGWVAGVPPQHSIDSGEAVSLTIDAGTRELSAAGLGRSERLPSEVVLAWTSGVDRFAGASRAPGRAPGIVFLPDGTSSGGKLSVQLGGVRRSVRVSWVSGAAVDEP